MVLKSCWTVLKCIRRTKYFYTLYFNWFVFEIYTSLFEFYNNFLTSEFTRIFFQTFLSLFLVHVTIIKHDLMITSYYNFILEIHNFIEKIKKLDETILSSSLCEIPSMDKNVSFHIFYSLFYYFVRTMSIWYG